MSRSEEDKLKPGNEVMKRTITMARKKENV